MLRWARDHLKLTGEESQKRLVAIQKDPSLLDDPKELRGSLLDFIADFANWDNSTIREYLEISRELTGTAHASLTGVPDTRPLVVDPFAGGGSIPLESLRVGADTFASDLNPVAVLLNKVLLEYIPKYGKELVEQVREIGKWVNNKAQEDLAGSYPNDPDSATPLAYLWARTIVSEAPAEGREPVEVPLLRSMWLSKKPGRERALAWVRDKQGRILTEVVDLTYADGRTRTVRRPLLKIIDSFNDSELDKGTVGRGSVTCPVTGFTTPVARVREQLKGRAGGTEDARLLCVVTTQSGIQGRQYRMPVQQDLQAVRRAAEILRQGQTFHVPSEEISLNEIRRISIPLYGMTKWRHLFTSRQLLALTTLVQLVRKGIERLDDRNESEFKTAVQTCLALAVSRQTDYTTSLCTWHLTGEKVNHTFARQALPMVWDYTEVNPFSGKSGDFGGALNWVIGVCEKNLGTLPVGHSQSACATKHPLPNDSSHALITDPPYYDAIPYAHLSDFFFVWLKRILAEAHGDLFCDSAVPKEDEIVVDRPHELSTSTKDIGFYENELTKAFAEARRVANPAGIGTVIFASKTTASWEALLEALNEAGWIITASWPLDTEMASKVSAIGQARLMSSIHIVCRPRENPDGSLRTDTIGEWREILARLPRRVHEWLPRLAEEGIVGADAIFACLGPALEIFSQYSSVEKASGEVVELKDYLEHVWAAVAREALSMIFEGADATGFEEDARLTAMWLWTLRTSVNGEKGKESNGKVTGIRGYTLEYDAARKIAQGLGAHLENLDHLVEVKGDKATLLSAGARVSRLFGKEARMDSPSKRGKKSGQMAFDFARQIEELEQQVGGWAGELSADPGATVLDQLHQAMILFGAGRGEAMKRLLVEYGVGRNALFWRLAQSLSALYPAGSEEKRWVDGVLGRKKGLGF